MLILEITSVYPKQKSNGMPIDKVENFSKKMNKTEYGFMSI